MPTPGKPIRFDLARELPVMRYSRYRRYDDSKEGKAMGGPRGKSNRESPGERGASAP